MVFKWFPPLDRIFGQTSELAIKQPESLGRILTVLVESEPEFKPYASFGPDDKQPHGLLAWRNGSVLTLEDMVENNDELEMIIMVAGG